MECCDNAATTGTPPVNAQSPNSPPSSPSTPIEHQSPPTTAMPPSPPPRIILSPCAACKILRRRCVEKCVLAPYFPPTDPLKFTIAHRVFGASNIIKLLQELPELQRADAVSSMVYEATARIRDPVYGCAGAVCQLQRHVSELQMELAKTQAELANLQCQYANLLALICVEMSQSPTTVGHALPHEGQMFFSDDSGGNSPGAAWGPLWT